MTRAEVAASAAIAAAFYLSAAVLELLLASGLPVTLGLILAKLSEWTGTVSSLLYRVTHQIELSAIIACFAPFLFVPFGKKALTPAE